MARDEGMPAAATIDERLVGLGKGLSRVNSQDATTVDECLV